MIKNILLAAAIGAAAMGAHASTNLVQNGALTGTTGSYIYNDAPSTVTAFYGSVPTQAGTVADWTGSFVSIAGNSSPWGNPGSLPHAGWTSGYVAGVQADGELSQALDLQAGTYLLRWSDANRGGANQSYAVSFDGTSYQSYATHAGAGWAQESIVFTLTEEEAGLLTFKGLTSYQNTDATSFIDNVSVTAVPEPTSLMLMFIGTLGLVAWRRRAQV